MMQIKALKKIGLFVALFAFGSLLQAAQDSWDVERGQSLSKIVRQLLPNDAASRPALMQAIVDLNPRAFGSGNPDKMYAGVTLKLPDLDQLQAAKAGSVAAKTSTKPFIQNSRKVINVASPTKAGKAVEPVVVPTDGSAGRVVYSKGRSTAAGLGGNVRELNKGAKLFEGDTLNTGPGSYLRVRYSDGGTMLLRPRTRLQLQEYTHTGDEGIDRNFMRLVKGGFRTVTGAIGRNKKDAYLVSTPVATIGIRGTDYSALFCAGDCVNLPDGLYTTTDSGSTVVSSGGATKVVSTGQSVFVPAGGGVPQGLRIKPRILSLPDPGCD
ncbi:MAG: FecR domain-containing protein [Immundisolibacteraceae bacterium]|nr:FecR domain-containing protein [Immundisolibacteraceae bacterium]